MSFFVIGITRLSTWLRLDFVAFAELAKDAANLRQTMVAKQTL
jgi:hypothetical protein